MNKSYTVFWANGKNSLIKGQNISDAMRNNKIKLSDNRSISFHKDGDVASKYVFDEKKNVWMEVCK